MKQLKQSTNRRLWSLLKAHGDIEIVEYASPVTGPVRRVPVLSLMSESLDGKKHPRESLAMYLMGISAPLTATLAREQFEGG